MHAPQAEELGVKMDKKVHGGASACRAMAGVIKRMLEDGATLSDAVTIPEGCAPRHPPRHRCQAAAPSSPTLGAIPKGVG